MIRRMAVLMLSAIAGVMLVQQTAFASGPYLRNCARQGNLICETNRFRVAVGQLEAQPAMTLPGQWTRPDGRALVRECMVSYPNTLTDKGIPNAELMTCLLQPDPRITDHRVITLHQAHVMHVNHMHHLATL